MAEENLLPADALEKNKPKRIHPIAGFWLRFGALVIDIFLLRLVLQVSYPVLRLLYAALGASSVAFGALVVFLYLALAEGPVGKGMTVGKAVLGIRTTDLEGEMVPVQRSAVRALVFLVLALPFLGGRVLEHFAANGERTGIFVTRSILNGGVTAYVVANVFLVVLHPLKQTVHDLAAGTIVVRESGAHNLASFMEEAAGQIAPLGRRAFKIAGVVFVALGALNIYGDYKMVFSPAAEKQYRFLGVLKKNFSYGGMIPLFYPTRLDRLESRMAMDGLTSESWAAGTAPLPSVDKSTSSLLHTVVFEFRSPSALSARDIGTSEELAALGSRLVEWTERQIRDDRYPLDRLTRTRPQVIFQPRRLALLFVEETNVLLYRVDKIIWGKVFPLSIPRGFYDKERGIAPKGPPKAPRPGDRPSTATRTVPPPETKE